MSDYHCVSCFADMIDTCPCRCCGPVYECEECHGCHPCYAGECQMCQDEAAAEELKAALAGSLVSTTG